MAARRLPLALQYVYTEIACGAFASYMISHPSAKGGRIIEIWSRDPLRLSEGETERYIHTAIEMADGTMLDAEGIRMFSDLCAAFGMRSAYTVIREGRHKVKEIRSEPALLLRQIADRRGWAEGAPKSADIVTATTHHRAAAEAFRRRDSKNRTQTALLRGILDEIRHADLKKAPAAEAVSVSAAA